ncbi:unnamed protein product [Caenorhabditis bovis]|uniref:RanBP1 domain containing protein n=1 Tax=Caenorhabditis bovis TaxID=2654633 RepID=A0A8S1EUC5_9PELO|nr:unnamed protein product [Caenorhabditis bovis]
MDCLKTLIARDTAPSGVMTGQVGNPAAAAAAMQQMQLQQAMMIQQDQLQRMAQAHAQAQAAAIANNLAKPIIPPVSTPQTKPVIQPPIIPPPVVPKPPFSQTNFGGNTAFSGTTTPKVETKPLFPTTESKSTPVTTAPASINTSSPGGFTFGQGSSSIFGKKPESSPAKPAAQATPKAEKEEDDAVDEYEPETEFKPVVPLPDLVEVKTGEEGEKVLFNNRCKLYIYSNELKEFKERGIGELKVLQNTDTKKYRVVMRREQVLKVCANFAIVDSMTIQQMAKNEKAYTWFCKDYSDEEPADVKLAARFASVEIATEFKELFEKAVAEYKSTGSTPAKPKQEKTIDKEIKPADKEIKKEAKEVVIPPNEDGFGDKFKPVPGSWECPSCYTRCDENASKCPCCGAGKDGEVDKTASIFQKTTIQPPPGASKFSFGLSAASVAAKEPQQAASPKFGASLSNGTSGTSVFGGNTPKSTLFGGGASSTTTTTPQFSFNKQSTATNASTPSFNFMKAAQQASTTSSPVTTTTNTSIFGSGATAKPVTFSFTKKDDTPASTGNAPLFSFNKQNSTPAEGNKSTETPKNVFGGFASGETFATLAAKAKQNNIFEGEAAKKAQEEFKALKKNTPLVKTTENADEEGGDENAEEYEPQVDFKPVVPLPDLVELVTGEENEEVIFKGRCKLYRYYQDEGNKERGVGDIKILFDKETNKYRVVMRREQVHKLCASFRIEKQFKLTMRENTNNVFSLFCLDFSEDPENGEKTVFNIRFKDDKIANQFRQKYEEAQEKSS